MCGVMKWRTESYLYMQVRNECQNLLMYPYTVRQEILTKEKFDEFDESFVSSIFNSSNFYRIMLGLSQSKHFVNI